MTFELRAIRRLVNNLPVGTARAANANFPISESRLHFVVFLHSIVATLAEVALA